MRRLSDFCMAIASLLLVAMAVLIVVEVAGRYLFGFSTLIADEYSEYMFVWMTFLGFAYALRTGQFLNVDIAVRRLPAFGRRLSDMLAGIAGVAVTAVLAWGSWQTVAVSIAFGTRSPQQSETLLWLPQIMMPIGMAVLALCFLELAVRALLGLPAVDAVAAADAPKGSVH